MSEPRGRAPDLREQFLAVATHELRTPVNSLRLTLESVSRTLAARSLMLPPSLLALLRHARYQSEHLARLTDALFDVARLQSDRSVLARERLDLRDVAIEVVDRLCVEATSDALSQVDVIADEPVAGQWNRACVDQIVTNLVSNALKYGRGRPVTVSVAVEGSYGMLVVRDRGIGIPEERIPHLFEPFERAVPATAYHGLGLGLYVVRQLSTVLGGHVDVRSMHRVGSTFTVYLPLGGSA